MAKYFKYNLAIWSLYSLHILDISVFQMRECLPRNYLSLQQNYLYYLTLARLKMVYLDLPIKSSHHGQYLPRAGFSGAAYR